MIDSKLYKSCLDVPSVEFRLNLLTELQLVKDNGNRFEEDKVVIDAFSWVGTPQGWRFWRDVWLEKVPKGYE